MPVQAGRSLHDIANMSEGDLQRLGVKTMGSRKRILAAAKAILPPENRSLGQSAHAGSLSVWEGRPAATITDFFLSKQDSGKKSCITDFFSAKIGIAKPPLHTHPKGKENRMQQPVPAARSCL